jgi:nitrate/nitrite transporter NarK
MLQMLTEGKANRMDSVLFIRMAIIIFHNSCLHHQPQHRHVCHPLLIGANPQHHRVNSGLSSSCFLATPITQVKDMFKKTRWLLTLLYLGSIGGTIAMVFLLPDHLKGLVILMLVVQIICYYLYTFSYIPFGRKILKKFCQCLLF